ncbi:MAG: ATP-dependent sacrificial sulfur transferase LarE [Intestinimonas sp.]|nr:ATP-dependent sacrificial sulfur transferase LarE [Intestinimonas sp.]
MELKTYFADHPAVAVALSGGVDSACLLWAAKTYARTVRAYCVQSAFQPEFEIEDAKVVAEKLGVPLTVLTADVLADPAVVSNPADRCYFCKKNIFSLLFRAAFADGLTLVVDGTNASDDAGDRPGMRALREMGVQSPLRLCGLTKQDVRKLARKADLPVWDKPSYACLATRIPTGTPIAVKDLKRVERAERELFRLGFSDFRVRLYPRDGGCVQIPSAQRARAEELEPVLREMIGHWLNPVTFDFTARG